MVSFFNCTFTEEKEKVACEQPPSIENGAVQAHSEIYYSGDKVTYRCEGSYHLRGSSTITCNRGQWTLPPECVGMYILLSFKPMMLFSSVQSVYARPDTDACKI